MSHHLPVLADEVIGFLAPTISAQEPTFFLDCTLGGGGHTEQLLSLGESVFVVALDRDSVAVARAAEKLRKFGKRVLLIKANFRHVRSVCQSSEVQEFLSASPECLFHGILLDAGFSSDQLDDPSRGLSFFHDGPLDMRLDQSQDIKADDIVNRFEPSELRRVFRRGGLRDGAELLVKSIVSARPISGTKQLAAICESALRPITRKKQRESSAHPATVPFQAIRIAVNEELEALEEFFSGAFELLKPHGRLAVISFHSLEDKIVTNTMRQWEQGDPLSRKLPVPGKVVGRGSLLTKKAITPSPVEIGKNARSRSAKLRVFEKGNV